MSRDPFQAPGAMSYPSDAQELNLLDDAGSKKPKRTRWQGWHGTILGGIIAVGFSLVCNIIMLIIGLARYDPSRGRGHLAVGLCQTTPQIDTALHVLINILSALLLGASNAAMQCVSAPTRSDLDALHAKGATADIGISGFRNLKFMSPFRRTIWALLLLSSLPLHLLYNSVVTSTIATFQWHGYLVSADFTHGAGWNRNLTTEMHIAQDKLADLQRLAMAGTLQNLSRDDCIQAFSDGIAAKYASVLLVANNVPFQVPPNAGSLLSDFGASSGQHSLLISQNLTFVASALAANESLDPIALRKVLGQTQVFLAHTDWSLLWTPPPHDISFWDASQTDEAPIPDLSFVDHCLAEEIDNLCTVDTIPAIQGLVVLFNLVKLICLLVILYKLQGQPLITIGDAIASFLARPDVMTRDRGFIDMTLSKGQRNLIRPHSERSISHKRRRWFRGVSASRWITTSLMCISYWIVGIVGLALVTNSDAATDSIYSGFHKGEINDESYHLGLGTRADSDLAETIKQIVFANCFQLFLSIAYFQYNGVVTSMVLSREFTNFARNRKGLRVSLPEGSQRRTFWLSLPYIYSAPLLILAGLLHWLLSEAIFYQEVATLDGSHIFSDLAPGSIDGAVKQTYLIVEPLFVLVVVAAFCMLVVGGLGFRRYAGGIPIVRSNSLAISAACHPQFEDSADVTKPIQWGVRGRDSQGIADVGFSSDDVDMVDPSLLRRNAVEHSLHRFKSRFSGGVAPWFRWKRTRHPSDSTDAILMQQGIHLYPSNGDDGKFTYAPSETAYVRDRGGY